MVTVWILVAYLGGSTPVVVQDIATEEACNTLAQQMFLSPRLDKKDKPACFQVQKVTGR